MHRGSAVESRTMKQSVSDDFRFFLRHHRAWWIPAMTIPLVALAWLVMAGGYDGSPFVR